MHGSITETSVAPPNARSRSATVNPFESPAYLAERRLFRWIDGYLKASFVAAVLIPCTLIALYYALWASDQYTSEVRAVLRAVDVTNVSGPLGAASGPSATRTGNANPNAGGDGLGGGLPNFGRGNTMRTAPKDAYIIQEYVKSAAIIDDLKAKIDLENLFRGNADRWARFPKDGSAQKFLTYWQSRIEASVEGPAGVLIIRLRSFSAQDSQRLLRLILDASERMTNDLQRQILDYALARAIEEKDKALAHYRQTLDTITRYRADHQIVDPYTTLQASSQLLLVALSERAKVQSDLRFMKEMMSEQAPSVQALQEKLRSLNEEIQKIQGELTGSGRDQKSLAEFLTQYEELELRRVLAERMLANAYDSVEKGRLRLEQQKIYVEPFIGPTQMDTSDYPKRVLTPLIISVFVFMLWAIHGLILLAIRDQLI
jgi:capsular polysaccharide transport system permease protein